MASPAHIARVAAKGLKDSVLSAYGFSSLVSSYLRPQAQIRERRTGEVDLGTARRIAVFSHFDRHGRVQDYVHYYLRQLHAAGYAVVFVSTAPRFGPGVAERLVPLCSLILRRDNIGLDFGAYKAGIQTVPDLSRLDSLLLVNDSVYGPFHDLGSVIGRMNPVDADVWGITDSWERRFHLQSFFLLFGRRALASPAFERFWAGLRDVQAKIWIISRYEIGLSRAMLEAGLRCRALFPYRALALGVRSKEGTTLSSDPLGRSQRRFLRGLSEVVDAGIPLNPTHFLWDALISMGCPFLKRELLRDNPAHIPAVVRWEHVLRSVSDYDTDLIVRDLELSMRKRSV